MPESNVILYATAEFAILLVIICIYLFFYANNLKKLIRKLEDKIVSLRTSISISRKETQKALEQLAAKEKIKPKSFLDYLDAEIDETRNHHQSLNPDRDIVLDIGSDAPLDRQAASLRHALLIAEKEARYAGENDDSNWDVLQSKLQQIIQFYQSAAQPAPSDEADNESGNDTADTELIESYKKRIENLERFKKLFFDMESKWEQAKQQADEYCEQLKSMGKDLGAGEDFEDTLERYSRAFNEVGDLIAEGSDTETTHEKINVADVDGRRGSAGKTIIANQEEMQRLRNMAVDQHKVITELKKKLNASDSAEEQQQVVEELSEQLEKQQRFLQEAETCTQLIEDELSRTLQENETLRKQMEEGGVQEGGMDAEELQRLETVVADLTNESKDMLATIATLEQENQTLKQQIESGSATDSEENTSLLKEKLGEMQQDLLNLQTQHIELEERYLELKMK